MIKEFEQKEPTFAELAASLDKSLTEVITKKDVFDKATEAVNRANKEYEESVTKANTIRYQLEQALSNTLGISNSRIRGAA